MLNNNYLYKSKCSIKNPCHVYYNQSSQSLIVDQAILTHNPLSSLIIRKYAASNLHTRITWTETQNHDDWWLHIWYFTGTVTWWHFQELLDFISNSLHLNPVNYFKHCSVNKINNNNNNFCYSLSHLGADVSSWQHTTLTRDRYPCPGGIRTHNPSKRAAADPRLRPRGHWDRHSYYLLF